ncbi:titin-like [Saccostrea cucullata]|uniref:titin-like n=1 Tax=Saccostrea cuccullata TaxID=36930 RepID=UPI002ED322C8
MFKGPITVSLTGPDSSVTYGSSINFTATIITGASLTAVAWQKVGSGESLSNITVNSTKYTQTGDLGSGTVVLTINNLNYSDEVSYQVQVTNSLGRTDSSNPVSVDVAGGPPSVFVSGPTQSDGSVTIGCTATVTTDSPGITAIKWTINETEINITNSDGKYSGGNVTIPALTINSVDSSDAGVYLCVATNPAGSTTSDNNVTLAPPSDLKVTGTLSVVHNSTATFSGSYTSVLPSVNITWQKQGTNNYDNIDIGSPDGKYTGSSITGPSPKLVINYVKFSDGTSYRMVVSNGVGSTNSDPFKLEVTGAKPIINIFPLTPTVYGQSATITAHVASDPPATGYVWQKSVNDMPENITSTDKYNITGNISEGNFSVSLTINDVKFTDQANYTLVVTNSVGSHTSNAVTLNVTGGELTVTTGPNVTGRVGRSVTINCTVTGPEVNNILWKKVSGTDAPKDITIDGTTYTGGSVSTPSLTIVSLTSTDAGDYQCTASNPGGNFPSNNKAEVSVLYGQFNEDCTETVPCDHNSSYLICNKGKCLCNTTSYHKDKVCHPRTRLTPYISAINSSTSQFSVFWSHPSVDFDLVISYRVYWRQNGGSTSQQGVDRGKNTTIINSGLMSGQRYIVTVSAVVRLTEPEETITIDSYEKEVRLDPLPPGSILHSESSFAHNNLTLKWTPPSNTFITKYEVMIDSTIQFTAGSNPWTHFTKTLTPGKYYVVSIVTISGTSNEPTGEKRSAVHTETIRINPTRPGPPINVNCPQHPKDISLEISWEPPTNPNGEIVMYQIHVNPGGLTINTPDNVTKYNVMGLSEEVMYNFTVRTINDAEEAQKVSDPSEVINCSTKAGVSTPPTKLNISEIGSRGFKIRFEKPVNVNGQLAGNKIIVLEGSICVQEIYLVGHCPQCKEIQRLKSLRETPQRKLQQVGENIHSDVEQQRETPRDQITGLMRESEISKKLENIHKYNLEQRYREETQEKMNIVNQLVKERNRYTKEASNLTQNYTEDNKVHGMQIVDFKRISGDDTNIRQQEKSFKTFRDVERTYNQNIIESRDEIAEMKRRVKIVDHQIDQHKEQIQDKENAFIKEYFGH